MEKIFQKGGEDNVTDLIAKAFIVAGWTLGETNGEKWIECKACGRRSHNVNDINNRYCGNCHKYHWDSGIGVAHGQATTKASSAP